MRPLLVAALVAIATTVAAADVILHDDFDDGFAGWTSSGDVDRADLTALVPDAVRLRQGATIERTVSTVGYTGVQISAFLAASLLEGGTPVSSRCRPTAARVGRSSFTWRTVMTIRCSAGSSPR